MTDLLEEQVLDVIQDTLRSTTGDLGLVIGPNDSMDSVRHWDSMSFMTVFLAVNESFDLDPDFDDAIHYMAVPSLVRYLREQVGS